MRLVVIGAALLLGACPPAPTSTGEGEGEGDAAPVDFGFVFVTSEPDLGFAQAGAVFRRLLPHAFDCQETDVAGCTVLTCGNDALSFDPVSAGAIVVDGAAVPIALSFATGAGYGDVNGAAPLFAGGEQLVATAPGDAGGVPAFSLTVTAPSVVDVTAPTWPAQQDVLNIVRADGLDLAWTGTSAGDVNVVFNNADQTIEVTCAFPAAAGSATVPAAALQALPAGDGFVDVELRTHDDVNADTWAVDLAAVTHARAAGQPAIASITLE